MLEKFVAAMLALATLAVVSTALAAVAPQKGEPAAPICLSSQRAV
jgi:hypothetical protein